MNIKGAVTLTIVILILVAGSAGAHRLYIDYRIGKIEIESFYGGGSPCQDAIVKVYNNKEELLQEGKTDKEGKYSFSPVIGVNEYKIIVEPTHMPGHRAERIVNLKAIDVSKVKAEELPLFSKVLAGFGWLAGIAGASMAYIGWREKKKYRNKKI